jgi:NAD(P)-dependent dehydrogenase (short-subunit alcohol dehydrogenase family)
MEFKEIKREDALQVDATKPADIEACVKAVLEKHGRIDAAANCVGSIVLKPAHSTTEDEFSQTLGW